MSYSNYNSYLANRAICCCTSTSKTESPCFPAPGANEWHRMTLVRIGSNTYTTTLQNLDAPSAVYSYSGTVASTNLNVRMGGFVSCISGALSKYLDIDYIGNYFNSAH